MIPRSRFEWSIASKGRERECFVCSKSTAGTLTLASGLRKPLCSICFSTRLQESLALIGARHKRSGIGLWQLLPGLRSPLRKSQFRLHFNFSRSLKGSNP